MVHLTREIRFSIDRDWAGRVELSQPKTNSWGGWPSAVGIVPYLLLRATVVGQPQQPSGYLCNIRIIDELLREHAIPRTADVLREHGWRMPAEQLLIAIFRAVVVQAPANAPIEKLELAPTPTLTFVVRKENPKMVYLTQQFEFSAAHRLHCDDLSDSENRETFGKCNNPNGHGHNYFLDVTVRAEPDKNNGIVLPLPRFEKIVHDVIIARFDHKHLNLDTEEFRALNPSVENIASVCWRLLKDAFAPVELARVRVWETPKTSAEITLHD
ncbi:MAG: 6-pyruvoyl tetrahydropterin synthase family protein [Phycisphaerae bacterium]